jgi:cytochrome c oxidase subunit III
MIDSLANRHSETAGGFALRFFHVLLLVFGVAAGLATGLIYVLPVFRGPGTISLPWAFWVSTVFLLLSSLMQHRSVQAVRRERQQPFRRDLFLALTAGVGFAAVQTYGLWCLWQTQPRSTLAASTGPEAFVFVLAVLHGLHVSIAIMFLTFVFLKSRIDRYDHEYYWGVTVCAWFWHALGLAWLAIVVVFLIAT